MTNREIIGKKILHVGGTLALAVGGIGAGLMLMNVRESVVVLLGGLLIVASLYLGGMRIWKLMETK